MRLSRRETCTCDTPSMPAISVCVLIIVVKMRVQRHERPSCIQCDGNVFRRFAERLRNFAHARVPPELFGEPFAHGCGTACKLFQRPADLDHAVIA